MRVLKNFSMMSLSQYDILMGVSKFVFKKHMAAYGEIMGIFYVKGSPHASVAVWILRDAVRFGDLTADETRDLWLTAQKVGTQLESYHKASSLAFAIQDGPQAGQTVPHVHIHIVPRKAASSEENDGNKDVKEKQKLDLDIQMKNRTMEEMAQEADEYRSLLSKI
ncbi:hypothetical protein CUMW_198620 [Citrus unshiu]|nr:hypothetical protein CUMW_198620 [Citrus unshiu]